MSDLDWEIRFHELTFKYEALSLSYEDCSTRCIKLAARLADEQAKRVAAESRITDLEAAAESDKIAAEVSADDSLERDKRLTERVADLERRLSTVPEDFDTAIAALLDARGGEAYKKARAALTEKIAALVSLLAREREWHHAECEKSRALQSRLEAYRNALVACGVQHDFVVVETDGRVFWQSVEKPQ